jgi:glycosyltransferase involved in cell wall biosynthesis
MSKLPKVSAVMCTYKRFKCVERAMNCFLAQDYKGEKELIIFNTDVQNPYFYDDRMKSLGVIIVNKNIDSVTNEPYTNVGAIRRDALTHATGDYTITWDDDDIFLPYFIRQGIDRIIETGLPSFKPEQSFFYSGDSLRLVKNTLEASIVVDIKKVRDYGYLLETGKEGLAWYTKMRDNKELNENDSIYLPSYCFNWNDGDSMNAQHKQSGDIDNPNNFANHKEASKDICNGELQLWSEQRLGELFDIYYNYILNYEPKFSLQLVEKYLMPNF